MTVEIEGVIEAQLDVHADERGSFAEILRTADVGVSFAQSNHSRSRARVLRGLHYHVHQGDLWYVVSGTAQVALVDLRTPEEVTVRSLIMTSEDPRTVYIPPGVAHGFLALTDLDLIYWVTRTYDASDEHGIAWNDPVLAIPWRTDDPILSPRDQNNPKLEWSKIPRF
ncbi:MAG: dTDP-4-dehydrorhamnose 3,5-epimerase family protein [Actinomycetota bacterium]|nr:dTDP-4-dehydrorhamnose 3,5-epimerase family protein [Actinomycetota bacterium]